MAKEKQTDLDLDLLDEMRHRKKRPQTSKSQKRADHKHQYEKVIVQTIVGWDWGQHCMICGRFSNRFVFVCRDFMRPHCKHEHGVSSDDFYSLEELLTLFPDVPIYLRNDNFELVEYKSGER